MKTKSFWFVILSACTTVHAQQAVRSYPTTLALDVGTEGQVVTVTPAADLAPMLAKPVAQAVSQWRFLPVVRDGKAVTARTYAAVDVEVVQKAGGYGVRVNYRSNGANLHSLHPPAYPIQALREQLQGTVVMDFTVQPEGKIADARVFKTTFGGHDANVFTKAIADTLSSSVIEPEKVDGKPIATHMRVPFSFKLAVDGRRSVPSEGGGGNEPKEEHALALDSPVVPRHVAPPG